MFPDPELYKRVWSQAGMPGSRLAPEFNKDCDLGSKWMSLGVGKEVMTNSSTRPTR